LLAIDAGEIFAPLMAVTKIAPVIGDAISVRDRGAVII